MSPAAVSRRRLLAGVVLTLTSVGLAGCSGSPPDGAEATESGTNARSPGQPSEPDGETTEPEPSATPTDAPVTPTSTGDTTSSPATESAGTSDGELDLREANVVGVERSGSNGSYRFDVTLYHDDDGEDGYADWWQVETLDGERLGRRTLLHAHSTAPFTRSERVSLPDGTTFVVVRGHDQTHGYGGQAMVVDVETGGTQAVRQGPEPRDFSGFEPSA